MAVAIEANTGQMNMGQLGVTRATSDLARAFARRTIDLHAAANQRLLALGLASTTASFAVRSP
jgi:hypothetical protein